MLDVPAVAAGERVSVPRVSRPAAASVRPASEDVVKARDAALVARLRIGPASLEQLVTAMPTEDGQGDEDRRVGCSSALVRLRVKKLIRPVEGGFAIA